MKGGLDGLTLGLVPAKALDAIQQFVINVQIRRHAIKLTHPHV